MNRNNKLKPLAPRPVQDRSLQHMTSYASSSAGVPDGHAGSIINSNAFAGANLGVHASPLEAVTSMDPKDYVWGGGYNASFQEYQQPAYPAYGEPYCYPQAQAQGCMYNMQYGYNNCYPDVRNAIPSSHDMCYPAQGSVAASDEDRNHSRVGHVANLSNDQAGTEVLDSKVDDLLDLDDDALRKLLKPCDNSEIAFGETAEVCDNHSPRRKLPNLEPMRSAASNASDADELIMPDFGEGFNRSDAMLLTMPSTSICPEAPSSNVDSRNPYLDPLLDPSTSSGGVFDTSKNCYAAETQSSSPASTVPSRETAEAASGNVLSEMSMADAIKCITGFLSTDSRIAEDKRQAAIAAVQSVAPRKSVVISLRKTSIIKTHPKRKRSSLTRQQ